MQNNTKFNKLSVVMPVYNEKETLLKILSLVEKVELSLEKEIILVDDGSTDGTTDTLRDLEKQNKYKIIFSDKNEGKGASLKKGFALTTGDVILIQDADLEYDPEEYKDLIEPVLDNKADVVFSSRFLGAKPHRVLYFWHFVGNKIITLFSNMFSNLNLTDIESCYKVFRKEVLDSFKEDLQSKRFGIEPELIQRCAKKNKWRIYEVGVSYYGRTYVEGKKINWKDGVSAICTILKFGIFK